MAQDFLSPPAEPLPPPVEMMGVVLIAADPLVRGMLAERLSPYRELPILQELSRLEEGAGRLQGSAEVVLLDAGVSPEPAPRDLTRVGAPVLVLVADARVAEEAWSAGARGLLFRDVEGDVLAAGLSALARGLTVLDPELEPPRRAQAPEGAGTSGAELTPREREVLQLLARGLPNKLIAQRLQISDHTAKFHVTAILQKLGVERRTEAVVRAARLGWVTL